MTDETLHRNLVPMMADFEEQNPVDEYEFLGWRVWPYLRIAVCWEALTKSANRAGSRSRRGVVGRVAAAARILGNRWRYRPSDGHDDPSPESQRADLVVFAPSSRRERVGDALWHRTADPVIDLVRHLDRVAVLWEEGDARRPRRSPSSWVTPRLERETRARRPEVVHQLPDEPPAWFDTFAESFERSFGHRADWRRWRRGFADLVARSQVFEGWLRSVRPRGVVVDVWYDPMCMALTAAARRLGIPSVDLQHGRQGALHFAYCGWVRRPPGGFGIVPEFAWVWGEADRQRWRRDQGPGARPMVFGNAWLNVWRDHPDQFAAEHEAARSAMHDSARRIVLTTQHNFDLAATVEAVADSPDNWSWFVRFHPGTPAADVRSWTERFRNTGHPGLDLEKSNRLPLYALLSAVDVHVTACSSCALEALAFGVPTLLTHTLGHRCYEKYVDDGVMFARSESNLVSCIAELDDRSVQCRAAASETFAESASAINAIRTLLSNTNSTGNRDVDVLLPPSRPFS